MSEVHSLCFLRVVAVLRFEDRVIDECAIFYLGAGPLQNRVARMAALVLLSRTVETT